MAPCVAPLLLSHHVPQGWLRPASFLALHGMNQLRVPGGDRVSPPALLNRSHQKIAGLINDSLSPGPQCQCFAELMGVCRERGK